MIAAQQTEEKQYNILPTLQLFHESPAQIRCIVGPVGSGKTTAASWEFCYYLPHFLLEEYGIKKTRWLIVRNTYSELIDTTQKTVFEWFDWGDYKVQQKDYTLVYPDNGPEIEILFRSCDNPKDIKKFKSLEITGYWIDESIEVSDKVKLMLKNRIGRYPRKCPVRFGIETTNPPDIEHPTYHQFKWQAPPPGPVTEKEPQEKHEGFWQPPRENEQNLRPNYYEDLINDYSGNPDWKEMYVDGKPGVIVEGKLVYYNFKRQYHVAQEPLAWSGGELYRGWDNSGNCPACVVLQVPTATQLQVLKEFHTDKQNIVGFTKRVIAECNQLWPDAKYHEYGDPAGANKFSTRDGGFTSNARLMDDECGITVIPSDNNFTARVEAVEGALSQHDGLLIDPGCVRLINGFLGGYCYPEIGTATGIYGEDPIKNRFSHPHDALQYVILKINHANVGIDSKPFVPRRNIRPMRARR